MDLQRRCLVLAGAATAALGLPASAAASELLDAFVEASARLCQRSASTLDRGMALRILQGLAAQVSAAELQALLRQPSEADPALVAQLRATWFSGTLETPAGALVVGFDQALAWDSAPFWHVPGTCGGATGYWAQAPGAESGMGALP